VLVKGGHLLDDSGSDGFNQAVDICYSTKSDEFVEISGPRIVTKNTHGTGCTLSAAIASCLALGDDPIQAMKKAKRYITEALRNSISIGVRGTLNHLIQIK